MKEILSRLIDLSAQQVSALQVVADHVSALKGTLLWYHPEMADDLNARMVEEQRKTGEDIQRFQAQITDLRARVSSLPEESLL